VTTFTRVVRIGIATTIVIGICWFIPLVSHWAFLWRINTLVSMAQSYPKDIAPARALIQIAKGPLNSQNQKVRSTYAIHAVGQVGPAASPVVSDLADLLDSPEVSQQSARALKNLGSISGPVANRIALRVSKMPRDATTWLAVNALGACGAAAEKHIPLLRTLEGREPEMFRGAVARAIVAIEDASEQAAARRRKKAIGNEGGNEGRERFVPQ